MSFRPAFVDAVVGHGFAVGEVPMELPDGVRDELYEAFFGFGRSTPEELRPLWGERGFESVELPLETACNAWALMMVADCGAAAVVRVSAALPPDVVVRFHRHIVAAGREYVDAFLMMDGADPAPLLFAEASGLDPVFPEWFLGRFFDVLVGPRVDVDSGEVVWVDRTRAGDSDGEGGLWWMREDGGLSAVGAEFFEQWAVAPVEVLERARVEGRAWMPPLHVRWLPRFVEYVASLPERSAVLVEVLPSLEQLFSSAEQRAWLREVLFQGLLNVRTGLERKDWLVTWVAAGLTPQRIAEDFPVFAQVAQRGDRGVVQEIIAAGLLGVHEGEDASVADARLLESVVACSTVATKKQSLLVYRLLCQRPVPGDVELARSVVEFLGQLDAQRAFVQQRAELASLWGVVEPVEADEVAPLAVWRVPELCGEPVRLLPVDLEAPLDELRRCARLFARAAKDLSGQAWWDVDQRVDPVRLLSLMLFHGPAGVAVVFEELQAAGVARPGSMLEYAMEKAVQPAEQVAAVVGCVLFWADTTCLGGWWDGEDQQGAVELLEAGVGCLLGVVECADYVMGVDEFLARVERWQGPMVWWDVLEAIECWDVWLVDGPDVSDAQLARLEQLCRGPLAWCADRVWAAVEELRALKLELVAKRPPVRGRFAGRAELSLARLVAKDHHLPGAMGLQTVPFRDVLWGLGGGLVWTPWMVGWLLSKTVQANPEHPVRVLVEAWRRGLVDPVVFDPMMLARDPYQAGDRVCGINKLTSLLVDVCFDAEMLAFSWPVLVRLTGFYVSDALRVSQATPLLRALVELAPSVVAARQDAGARAAVDASVAELGVVWEFAAQKGSSQGRKLARQLREILGV
ncbi:hypothetical protein [Corynebacterium aquilae]|uniref:Uncharacterized protein n=1 Tax=Corynebacterium aquilae DSM 44791 TaxID=1431546 RepID=A0A1L7CEH6_9CORY|nr:hypothetical protein [Corynebacterium aquilae]APT84272.1 hypothetical protein CAQU_03405 [Corynebacterium aquilae DSM 44791]